MPVYALARGAAYAFIVYQENVEGRGVTKLQVAKTRNLELLVHKNICNFKRIL